MGELLPIIREGSEMEPLVRACWCADEDSRPPFVEICQILETEKSRILELRQKEKSRILALVDKKGHSN